jgi:hypothetical protein
MRATTAEWLARVITEHTDELAQELAQFVQQTMPLYAEAVGLALSMRRYFAALALAAAEGDATPLRGYLEWFVPLRLQDGAQGVDYIQLINQGEVLVLALITGEAADADRANDAQRLARSLGHNARLIVSEVNLQLLINPARYDDGAPALLPPRIPTTPAA